MFIKYKSKNESINIDEITKYENSILTLFIKIFETNEILKLEVKLKQTIEEVISLCMNN